MSYKFVPSSNNLASFLFEKQYAFIYQVAVTRSFLSYKQCEISIDCIYLSHTSTLLFQASVIIRNHPSYL